MRVGLVVNPAIRGFLANSSIGARAAPSAKIFNLSRLGSDGVMQVLSRHLGYRSFSERPVEKEGENVRVDLSRPRNHASRMTLAEAFQRAYKITVLDVILLEKAERIAASNPSSNQHRLNQLFRAVLQRDIAATDLLENQPAITAILYRDAAID